MKIIALSQARMGSARLPGKVLKEIAGKSLLQLHLERLLKSRLINKVIVATTEEEDAFHIVNIASSLNVDSFVGNTYDVLDRFYRAAVAENPDWVVRVTADCPLLDALLVDELITMALDRQLDYVSNAVLRSYPDGMDVEVFKFKALEKAWKEATLPSDREHVTPYIWRNSTLKDGAMFSAASLLYPEDYSQVRVTVDEPSDLEMLKLLVEELGVDQHWKVYADYLLSHPDIRSINSSIPLNEGYYISLGKDNK